MNADGRESVRRVIEVPSPEALLRDSHELANMVQGVASFHQHGYMYVFHIFIYLHFLFLGNH